MHLSLLEPFADLSEGFHFYLKALLQCFQCFKNQLQLFFLLFLFFPWMSFKYPSSVCEMLT